MIKAMEYNGAGKEIKVMGCMAILEGRPYGKVEKSTLS